MNGKDSDSNPSRMTQVSLSLCVYITSPCFFIRKQCLLGSFREKVAVYFTTVSWMHERREVTKQGNEGRDVAKKPRLRDDYRIGVRATHAPPSKVNICIIIVAFQYRECDSDHK